MKTKLNSMVGMIIYKLFISIYLPRILTRDAPKNHCPRNCCPLRFHYFQGIINFISMFTYLLECKVQDILYLCYVYPLLIRVLVHERLCLYFKGKILYLIYFVGT